MDATEPLYFEDLKVGQFWDSEYHTLSSEDVRTFAELTGDDNPIHLDPEFARQTPFRRCIAHGMFGVSVCAGLGQHSPPMRTVALIELDKWRFLAPIYHGDSIRIRNHVWSTQLRGRGKRGEVVWRVEAINQHGQIVQEGFLTTLVETAAAGKRGDTDSPQSAETEPN